MAEYIQGGCGRLVDQPPRPIKMRPFDLRVGEWVTIPRKTYEDDRDLKEDAHYRVIHISDKVFLAERYIFSHKEQGYGYTYKTSFMKKDYMFGVVKRLRVVL